MGCNFFLQDLPNPVIYSISLHKEGSPGLSHQGSISLFHFLSERMSLSFQLGLSVKKPRPREVKDLVQKSHRVAFEEKILKLKLHT